MKDSLWDLFEKSGKISDYLRYKGYPGSDENGTYNSQRTGNKGTSVRG